MKLIFASGNDHKIKEIRSQIPAAIQLIGLKEAGITEDIPETADTLEGNAWQKADYLYDKLKVNCFSDDTGLEVEALDGAPGVYSARYAGPQKKAEDNMSKLLEELADKPNRKARFRTVIALIINGEKHEFEGVVNGEIMDKSSGKEGFGYDPIFRPNGYAKTFSEMSMEDKNKISHRGLAVDKLIQFLKEL